MVVTRDEKDKKFQKDADLKAYQRRKEVQQMQLLQICGKQGPGIYSASSGGEPSEVASSSQYSPLGVGPSSIGARRKKGPQGSHMTLEELRINKGLLKEISKKKRQAALE